MINQEEDIILIMMLLDFPILAEQCNKVHLLILWLVVQVLIANSTFLAVGIQEVVVEIVQSIASKNNIDNLHRNNIVQRPMEIIGKTLSRTTEIDPMIIRIATMEITDKNLTLSINSVLAKIGNGKGKQNGVSKCVDNVKNKSTSHILNIILVYQMSSN